MVDNVYVYKINKSDKLFQICFKIGFKVNVLYRVWRREYLAVSDSVATFNKPYPTSPEVRTSIPDFTITLDEKSKDFSFDELFESFKSKGAPIKNL